MIAICVFGNPLWTDDGVALKIFEYLKLQPNFLERNIPWIDCGTDTFSLTYLAERYSKIIVVDAADMAAEPGTVKLLHLDDLQQENTFRSAHTLSLYQIAQLLDARKQILFIGIQPCEIRPGCNLSSTLHKKIPEIAKKINSILEDICMASENVNLKEFHLLKDFAPDHLEFLEPHAELVEYERDQLVFKEDEVAEYIYCLKSGRVAIVIELPNEKQIVVYTVSPGQSFAWSSLVPPYRMTASAKCMDHAEIVKLPASAMKELFQKNPEDGYTIMARIAEMISNRLLDTRLQLINALEWK